MSQPFRLQHSDAALRTPPRTPFCHDPRHHRQQHRQCRQRHDNQQALRPRTQQVDIQLRRTDQCASSGLTTPRPPLLSTWV